VAKTGSTRRSQTLGALIARGSASRVELVDATGLSPATVSRAISELLRLGLVREGEPTREQRLGRSSIPLELAAERGLVCGVDLGATNVRLTIADLDCRPLAVSRQATPHVDDAGMLAQWLSDEVRRLVERANGHTGALWATVIGVPGVVHPSSGEIRFAPNLDVITGGWGSSVSDLLPGLLVVDNDANLALRGEMQFGAGRGLRSLVMFTIGTGIGAGVAVDGRLWRGRSGFAGEFGSLVVERGPRTLEQVASAPALLAAGLDTGLPVSSPDEVLAPDAPRRLVPLRERALQALLTAFSAASAAFEPEAILLGGGLAHALARWLPHLQKALAAVQPSPPDLLIGELGDLAGAAGALVVGLENAYARLGLEPYGLDGLPPARHRDEIIALLARK
jgi:predicted NBD/HSP70 family sugar kinase